MDNIFQMIWWVVELAILPLACPLLDIIIARDNTVTEKQILHQTLSVRLLPLRTHLSRISIPWGGWARQQRSPLSHRLVSRQVEHTSSWSQVLSFLSRTMLTREPTPEAGPALLITMGSWYPGTMSLGKPLAWAVWSSTCCWARLTSALLGALEVRGVWGEAMLTRLS